jgi:hypothetical protein
MRQIPSAMKPKFKLAEMLTEPDFLARENIECLPDDPRALADKFAAKKKISQDDVRVRYTKCVLFFLRDIREIYCRKDACWIVDARDCLKQKMEFDLIGATEANVADLKLETYADSFRWSELKGRHTFRLIQQTGDQ